MTHEELLAYINKEIDEAAWTKEYYPFKPLQALRAVVELHKPIHHIYPNGNELTECAHCNDGCWGCQEWLNCTTTNCDCKCHQAGNDYPCPTIQAIEKELG